MFKMMGSPERLYGFTMWLVSLVFAAFLVGLGGKIIADIPRTENALAQEQFADRAALDRTRAEVAVLEAEQRRHEAREQVLKNALGDAIGAYDAANTSFQNWLATRGVTANPQQDPEVLTRTRALDKLREAQRAAELPLEALRREGTAVEQRLAEAHRREQTIMQAAYGDYEQARRRQELKVFAIRLAFTLPLLLASGWMIARKRRSQYWPLMRGFILASAFAFFFELVPYLPDYGGYVRYAVGILLTLVAGHYAIRGMQAYLVRRRETEQQNEAARRASLDNEAALKKMAAKLCPACERAILTTDTAEANFCVHCGLGLYTRCGGCNSRMNVFFHHCASCGTPRGAIQGTA
jgi:predicted RNA-binding Zn-ribbon protein involved in translation (DUF1610 family)